MAWEIIVYMNRSLGDDEEIEVSRFVWEADSSSADDTLAQIGQMVQSSVAASSLEGGVQFVPQFAAIFSWRLRETGKEVCTCVQI